MVFKILNIPEFNYAPGDIIFQRPSENPKGEIWLSHLEIGVIGRLLGSEKDDYENYAIKTDVENSESFDGRTGSYTLSSRCIKA